MLARLPGNGGVCMVTFVPRVRLASSAGTGDLGARRRDGTARAGLLGPGDRAEREDGVRAPPPRAAGHAGRGGRPCRACPRGGRGGRTSAWAATSTAPSQLPEGLGDVSCYPALFAELVRARLERGRLRRSGRRQHPARAARGGAPQRALLATARRAGTRPGSRTWTRRRRSAERSCAAAPASLAVQVDGRPSRRRSRPARRPSGSPAAGCGRSTRGPGAGRALPGVHRPVAGRALVRAVGLRWPTGAAGPSARR